MSVKSLIRPQCEGTESTVSKTNWEYDLCGSVTWGYKCKKFVEYGTQSHEITCQRHEHRNKGGVLSLEALQIPAGLNVPCLTMWVQVIKITYDKQWVFKLLPHL